MSVKLIFHVSKNAKEELDLLATFCMMRTPLAFPDMTDYEIVKFCAPNPTYSNMYHFGLLVLKFEVDIYFTNLVHTVFLPEYILESPGPDGNTILIVSGSYWQWKCFLDALYRNSKLAGFFRPADGRITLQLYEVLKGSIPGLFDVYECKNNDLKAWVEEVKE